MAIVSLHDRNNTAAGLKRDARLFQIQHLGLRWLNAVDMQAGHRGKGLSAL